MRGCKIYFTGPVQDEDARHLVIGQEAELIFQSKDFKKVYGTDYAAGNLGSRQTFTTTIAQITPPLSEPAAMRNILWQVDNRSGLLEPQTYGGVSFRSKRSHNSLTVPLAAMTDNTQKGSLIGVVKSVSQYPISAEGVRKGLGNAQLAQYVLSQGGGAAVEVKFDLVKDESSESGYLWTSVVGKHRPITAGSFCTGSIVIEREPPIEKVFYKISQWLRSR